MYAHENIHQGLLESKINSACSNSPVETKITHEKLYRRSKFQSVRALAAAQAGQSPVFSKKGIVSRSAEIATFAVQHWPLTSTLDN